MQSLHWILMGCVGGWRVLLQSCKSHPTGRRQNKRIHTIQKGVRKQLCLVSRAEGLQQPLVQTQSSSGGHHLMYEKVLSDSWHISPLSELNQILPAIGSGGACNRGLLTNFYLGKSPIRGRNWRVDHCSI